MRALALAPGESLHGRPSRVGRLTTGVARGRLAVDAMHAQDAHTKYVHRRRARHVLIAEAHRPTLVR